MNDGADQIRAERDRQIISEGYSVEHDLIQGGAVSLIDAARTYALTANGYPAELAIKQWPWSPKTFKPTGDSRRDLVKAGALIAAAIDQLNIGASA